MLHSDQFEMRRNPHHTQCGVDSFVDLANGNEIKTLTNNIAADADISKRRCTETS